MVCWRRPIRIKLSGFTLLELMIVLALLAFLVAMVWPSLRKPLQRSATQQAARQLMEDLGRARLNAIETGRAMAVRYETGGQRYWIGPADQPIDELSDFARFETSDGQQANDDSTQDDTTEVKLPQNDLAASAAAADDANDTPLEALVIQGTFDDGVIFEDPAAVSQWDALVDSPLGSALADEMAETEEVEPLIQDETTEINWSAPIMIYPTGRAENASFTLKGPNGYWITVTLRGLTGAVTIGPLEHEIRADETSPATSDDAYDEMPQDTASEPVDSSVDLGGT